MAGQNINITQSYVLRQAADVQTNNNLLYRPPVYTHRTHSVGGISDSAQAVGIRLRRWSLFNAAAASPVGLGWRFINRLWIAGRLSADGATFTDLTSALQSRTATAVQVAGADQTGFVIGCRVPFGWVSANFTIAETNAGGTTVADHTLLYSLGASWSSAFTTPYEGNEATDGLIVANTVWSATIKNLVWAKPIDWAVSAGLGGVPDGYYWVRFTSAEREASDVAAQVTGIEIGDFGVLVASLAQNALLSEAPATADGMPWSEYADGVVAFFGTANAGNVATGFAESA